MSFVCVSFVCVCPLCVCVSFVCVCVSFVCVCVFSAVRARPICAFCGPLVTSKARLLSLPTVEEIGRLETEILDNWQAGRVNRRGGVLNICLAAGGFICVPPLGSAEVRARCQHIRQLVVKLSVVAVKEWASCKRLPRGRNCLTSIWSLLDCIEPPTPTCCSARGFWNGPSALPGVPNRLAEPTITEHQVGFCMALLAYEGSVPVPWQPPGWRCSGIGMLPWHGSRCHRRSSSAWKDLHCRVFFATGRAFS